ncbi:hypothetical protein JRO89_XS06G0096300 [Xanthoceras sorbifolium]|uniref:non-specific serine/threonine protein kinase n=1 Tax=Xanthoceras sorbifolium TaxID=99658 RepID=A0ABQ8HXH6_9ROSI|nr:hypothetical protein JRO89_XS06G0096300 [Xanthoceras sorbifolium]
MNKPKPHPRCFVKQRTTLIEQQQQQIIIIMMIVTRHHFCAILFSITIITIFPTIAISADSIAATQALTSGQTLVSSGDVFELGFFSPASSGKWYLGIWYKNLPDKTYVWVANRDYPLANSSAATLKITDQSIVLLDQDENLVWSSNQTKVVDNPVAQLLDSGNFVLREADKDDEFLWQSFDYPTDTLLPGMKLGWDLRTGFDKYITSWRDSDDPSSGPYSFKLDYHGFPEFFLWNKQVKKYRSGPWNGLRFSGVPEMKPQSNMDFDFVVDQDEVYYSFNITSNNLFSRLIVNKDGMLQRLTWIPSSNIWNPFWFAPKDQCDDYRECGPFGVCDTNASPVCKCMRGFQPRFPQAWSLRDGSGGCVRKTDLECTKDKFLHLKNIKLPETTTSFLDKNMTLKECGDLCSRNCSCTAYASSNIIRAAGCVIWTGELLDMRQYAEGGQDLYVRLAASDIGDDGNVTSIIIGITVGSAVLILGLVGCFLWRRKVLLSNQRGNIEQRGSHGRSQDFLLNEVVISSKRDHSGEKTDDLELPLFDFDTLPKTPGFCLGRNPVETDSSSSKQDETFTVNQVTVTMLDARTRSNCREEAALSVVTSSGKEAREPEARTRDTYEPQAAAEPETIRCCETENLETPINNSAGIFKIGGDGNLAVLCGNQSSPLWSTNVSVEAGTSTTAKPLDSGNLILVAKETIIWQSFDYPTDTVLPGLRFGLNWKTGTQHILTSWKSTDDPTPGEFFGKLDPDSIPQLQGHKNDYSDQIDLVNYTVVNNENESYFAISSKNGTLFSILVLDPMGTVKRLIWDDSHKWVKFWMAPHDLCDEYDRCGANEICNDENAVHCACLPGFQPSYPQDLYLKCAEIRKINSCGKGDGEGFVRLQAVKLPDVRNSTLYGNMKLKECQRECLKSCNCTGYAILDFTGSERGCITWYGELRDMRRYQDRQDFYLRVDAVELAVDARKNGKYFLATKSTLAFIIVPVVVEILLVALCCYYLWRRNVKRKGDSKAEAEQTAASRVVFGFGKKFFEPRGLY